VLSLSGGNQKVLLARALLTSRSRCCWPEPTQGVDVGARAEIYRILRQVADLTRACHRVVRHPGAAGLCDRVFLRPGVAELRGDGVRRMPSRTPC
jgi:ribose transport system ATP-binding protein